MEVYDFSQYVMLDLALKDDESITYVIYISIETMTFKNKSISYYPS